MIADKMIEQVLTEGSSSNKQGVEDMSTIKDLLAALQKIASLDPSEEGDSYHASLKNGMWEEQDEAICFKKAQKIAKAAIIKATKSRKS